MLQSQVKLLTVYFPKDGVIHMLTVVPSVSTHSGRFLQHDSSFSQGVYRER